MFSICIITNNVYFSYKNDNIELVNNVKYFIDYYYQLIGVFNVRCLVQVGDKVMCISVYKIFFTVRKLN